MTTETLDYSGIGRRFKEALIKHNISASEFSERCDISRFSITQWLKGKNLTADSLFLISTQLNISINWLIFGIGDQLRSSGYIPSEAEAEFIGICRHINHECPDALLSLLKSLSNFNAASRSFNAYRLTGDFFDSSNIPVAVVNMDGAILTCNPQFLNMLGIRENLSTPALPNIFSMVTSHYLYRFKCDMGEVFTNSVNSYNLYEFKHQSNGKIISIIAKSALVEHGGQLAQKMVFKEAT